MKRKDLRYQINVQFEILKTRQIHETGRSRNHQLWLHSMLCTALEAGDFIERLNTDTEAMGKVTGTNSRGRATSPGVYFTAQRLFLLKIQLKRKRELTIPFRIWYWLLWPHVIFFWGCSQVDGVDQMFNTQTELCMAVKHFLSTWFCHAQLFLLWSAALLINYPFWKVICHYWNVPSRNLGHDTGLRFDSLNFWCA